MPLLKVPEAVSKVAKSGLDAQMRNPIDDAIGVNVARQLASGEISREALTLCHQFFNANRADYETALLELRDPETTPVMRAWELHGGDMANAWAERLCDTSIDPLEELSTLPPPAIYERFKEDAWRHVYKLSPVKAAAFVEHYTIATGNRIDLDRAFGAASAAVTNAVERRLLPVDAASRLRQLACVRDPAYRLAVEVDAAAVEAADALIEHFPVSTFGNVAIQTFIKSAWPTVIAYLILACEDRASLLPVNHGKKPPALYPSQGTPHITFYGYLSYNDATNFVQSFFHPQGKRYKDPATLQGNFAGIDAAMCNLMYRAFRGKPLYAPQVQKTLNTARAFLAKQKAAGTIFATLLQDWKKGNWEGIMKLIPPAADVYEPFKAFAAKGLSPQGGGEFQQQPTNDEMTPELKAAMDAQFGGKPYAAVNLDSTASAKAAKAVGTPLGIHSVIAFANQPSSTAEVLGAFTSIGLNQSTVIAVQSVSSIKIYSLSDSSLADNLQSKAVTVSQGHIDIPGTTNYQKPQMTQDAPPTPVAAPAGSGSAGKPPMAGSVTPSSAPEPDSPVMKFVNSKQPYAKPWKIEDTAAYKTCKKTLGKSLSIGLKVTGETNAVFTIAGVFKSQALKFFVLQMENGEFEDIDDSDFASAFEDGSVWIAGIIQSPHGDGTAATFATADEYFAANFADSIKQWAKFEILHTDAAEAFLNKYNIDLNIGTALLDKNKHPFRVEGAYYNKYSGTTLIVYRNPDGTFNEIEDNKLTVAIVSGKATAGGVTASHLFPSLPSDEPEEEPEFAPAPSAKSDTLPASYAVLPDAAKTLLDADAISPKQTVSIDATSIGAYAAAHGVTSGIKYQANSSTYAVVGAYKPSNAGIVLFVQTENGQIFRFADEVVTGHLESGEYTLLTIANTSPDTSPDYQPKYTEGKYLILPGLSSPYIVVAVNMKTHNYVLCRFAVLGLNGSYLQKMAFSKLDNNPAVKPTPIYYTFPTAGTSVIPTPVEWGVSFGDLILVDGMSWKYGGAVTLTTGHTVPVFYQTVTAEVDGQTVWHRIWTFAPSSIFQAKLKSTYNPPAEKPEPASVNALDTPDAETGNPEMSGTQEAFDYVKAHSNLKPAVKSASAALVWDLGDVLPHVGGETKTVIGYAKSSLANGATTYVYVVKPQKGEILITAGKHESGKKILSDSSVINALLPLPGTPSPKFPKLNYALSTVAKNIAQKNELIYVPSPKDAAYPVGTLLLEAGHDKFKAKRLIGWVLTTDGPPLMLAVLSNKDGSQWFKVTNQTLQSQWGILYQHGNLVDEEEVVFGKALGTKEIAVKTPFCTLPDFVMTPSDPLPIKQPAMATLTKGHVSAGVLAVFPHGETIINGTGDDDDSIPLQNATVVMVHPMNDFGGYSLTFPKGTVDKGESIEKAAVREFFEETGMCVKIVGFLGDFAGDTSITRMFMGYVTNGNPHKAGWETDAVTLKPVDLTNSAWITAPWYKGLAQRDQDIFSAGAAWLIQKGYPHEATPEIADQYSQVTAPQDNNSGFVGTTDAAGLVTVLGSPDELILTSPGIDYPVSSAWFDYLQQQKDAFELIKILPQNTFWKKGYPKVNTWVLAPTTGQPVFLAGYTSCASKTEKTNYLNLWGITESGEFLFFVLYAGTKKWNVMLKPTDLKLAPGKSGAPSIATPAYDPKAAIWNTLVLTSPVPIPKALLDKIKKLAPDGMVTAAVTQQAEGKNAPAYGDTFSGAITEITLQCAGYVTFSSPGDDIVTYLLARTPAGNYLATLPDSTGAWPAVPMASILLPNPAFVLPLISSSSSSLSYGQLPLFKKSFDDNILHDNLGSYTLKQWKQLFKEAGVPNYTGLTLRLLPNILGLFLSNRITGAQRDHMLEGLKHVAEILGAGALAVTPPIDAASIKKVNQSAANIQQPPKLILQMGSYYSTQWKQQLTNLDPALFTKTSQAAPKGTNPTFILEGPGGAKWFGKSPKDGDPIRAAAEEAAYKVASIIEFETVPVGAMPFNGENVSVQPLIENLDPPEAFKDTPGEESDENKATILRNHAIDMFLTEHDGNPQNWLKKNGKLIRIDRSQAFKFYLNGDGPVLDPTYEVTGNFGKGYAKSLLIAWAKNKADIPTTAFGVMREAIGQIQEISDDTIAQALAGYFAAAKATPAQQQATLKKIYAARDAYLTNWTTVLKKLKGSFKWPDYESPAKNIFQANPKEQGFTTTHAAIIQEAIDSGWQGKALSIDGPYLENQEMMVRQVLWDVKAGTRVVATLIHFRMNRPGGLLAYKTMMQKASVSDDGVDPSGGPHRLKADINGNFWPLIKAAISTINHHYYVKKDTEPNKTTINAALALKPTLQSLKNSTTDPAGVYAPTGESNEIVYSMAAQYLDYLEQINYYDSADATVKQGFVGKHSPMFAEFMYEEPPAKKADNSKQEVPQLTVIVKKQGSVSPAFPQTWDKKDGIVISSLNNPVYNSSQQAQFHVVDDNAKAHIFFNPPGGTGGLKDGIEGHKGIGWGLMPGAPSPQTVAHLTKMLEQATGLPMKPSTQADQEALYWIKQGATIQNDGVTEPAANAEAGLTPELAFALTNYRNGDVVNAITTAKAFVAKTLKVSVDALVKQPGYDPDFGQYTRGAGWKRQLRINWTRDKLVSLFGPKVHFAHNVHANDSHPKIEKLIEFFNRVSQNGALLSNNTKAFYGVLPGGGSPDADVQRGGSQGLFLCLRKDWTVNHLYFDISLGLRTDVYRVGTGDTFGDTGKTRYMTPEQWVNGVGSGACSTVSSNQMNARHDVDLRQYLHTVTASTVAGRNEIRKICQAAGWTTFANGRTLEQVIVKYGEEVL